MLNRSRGYQCAICSEGIEDSRRAVVLNGRWMVGWEDESLDPPSQQFWVHSDCLKKVWDDAYPWDEAILYGEDEG